ncbi:hypothetical protein HHL26_03305 [Sphingobium sp. TB-6]|uniref:hypothetical protein n=1 Tax=Sphingobium sp. TB-6 TaxID=2728850 RepID=UPI00146B0C93|nr:hypothetical protein [Sphingobium sp. TB-6]NML88099.1 hypothetical protein [Sphingobium sp. TB-6]
MTDTALKNNVISRLLEVLARILPNSIIDAPFLKVASGREKVKRDAGIFSTSDTPLQYVFAYLAASLALCSLP